MKHAEAIERLKGRFMTVSMCATSAEAKAENEAIDMALAALRAEEEREKGCEGCGGRSSATRKLPYQCQYCCRNYCDQHDGRRGAAVELDGGGQDARKGEAE